MSYENVRGVHEDRGGILLRRRWSRTPVLSVSELFPAAELERVRRRSAERDARSVRHHLSLIHI